jgi:TusA-related sulfurtransferase
MAETVDVRGLSCPIPVMRTKAALEATSCGEVVVLLDEEVAKENVCRLARSLGCKVEVSEEAEEFKLIVTRE